MKKIIAGIVILILCVIVGMTIYYMQPQIQTVRTEKKTVEVNGAGSAVFIRDEKVYIAGTGGTVFNHFSDGDRVPEGATITTLFSGRIKDEYLAELSTIVRKINQATASSSYSYSNETQVESKINSYRSDIRNATMEKNVASARVAHKGIDAVRDGNLVSAEDGDIESLEKQYDEVLNSTGVDYTDITTDVAGIYTTVLDGFEDILTIENLPRLAVKDFDKVKNVQGEQVGRSVKNGESVCKVVNNHEWYVLALLKNKDIKVAKERSHVALRFDNIPGEQTDARIESITDNGDGTSMVLFKSTHYIEGAFSFRASNVTVVFESYTGYVLPKGAVYNGDEDSHYVYAMTNGVVSKYEIKIVYENKKNNTIIVDSADDVYKKLENSDEICTSLPKEVIGNQ